MSNATDRLARVFLAHAPTLARHRTSTRALEAGLLEVVARARREAPTVDLDPELFVRHLAARVTFDRQWRSALESVHAGALWIACGCVHGDASALSAFELTYANEITALLSRAFDSGTAQDAELEMRERLFLVDRDRIPRIASYSGRGDLRAWLRASALRTAIDLVRARRTFPVDPATLACAGEATDPLLDALKQQSLAGFRTAFAEAVSEMTDRQRTLLRLRFVEQLSIDEIAPLYRVHRATAARWLTAICESLFDTTRAHVMLRLGLTELEVDGALLVDGELDASVRCLLGVDDVERARRIEWRTE